MADIAGNAKFLKGWCKKKDIVRMSDDSTFWTAGKWMTKITTKDAQALVDGGYAECIGDPAKGGARLKMK